MREPLQPMVDEFVDRMTIPMLGGFDDYRQRWMVGVSDLGEIEDWHAEQDRIQSVVNDVAARALGADHA